MGGIEFMDEYIENRKEQGFTLIELLIAIVVVGILAAVAIVGIAGLTNTGGKSACRQSGDAAHAASAAYYANQTPNKWPVDFTAMTTGANPVYETQTGVAVNAADHTQLDGNGWTLHGVFDATGATAPNFDNCTTP
jgi:prepilin-type N-terminal cleavage/methylation domain-containing protein